MCESPPTRVATNADVAYLPVRRASRISFPALLTLAGVFALFSPMAVRAGTVYLEQFAPDYNPLGGGPFEVNVVSGFDGYKDNTVNAFETFCIEYNEEFYPGTTYQVNIANDAVFGRNGPPNGSDPLTSQTAWLYATWRNGGLAGVVNNNSPGDLYALQDAIWVEQGWQGIIPAPNDIPDATPGLETTLANLASLHAVNGDYYGVQVMQLWDIGKVGQLGAQHQDQLILVPAPTAAAGGLLLIVSALGVRYVKRRGHSAEI